MNRAEYKKRAAELLVAILQAKEMKALAILHQRQAEQEFASLGYYDDHFLFAGADGGNPLMTNVGDDGTPLNVWRMEMNPDPDVTFPPEDKS